MAPSASPAPIPTPLPKGNGAHRPEDDEVKPYVISQEIGKGSFATVYKGYHQTSHQPVAIKAVSRSILTSKLLENLKSEIDILKQLSHKHITLLTDIVHSPTHIHLIMEYCAGGDLSQYIKRRGRVDGLQYSPSPDAPVTFYPHPRSGGLEERCVRCFLRQLARALKFLRSRNLIHRDIKPQNLLLAPAGPADYARGQPLGVPILKVADFGFARILPSSMMAETLCGSPLYMAPEILRYEKYDAKADLWSVGAVLYEMSVGKPPFRAQNHIELLRKIESSKGIKFPDDDESHPCHPLNPLNPKSPYYQPGMGNTRAHEKIAQVVSDDLKALMRRLLVRHPVERASFDEFFASEGLRKSKFSSSSAGSEGGAEGDGATSAEQEEKVKGGRRVGPGGMPIAHRAPPAIPAQRMNDESTSARASAEVAKENEREVQAQTARKGNGQPSPVSVEEPPSEKTAFHDEQRRNSEQSVISSGVLDPRAMIPPTRFAFRRAAREGSAEASEVGSRRVSFGHVEGVEPGSSRPRSIAGQLPLETEASVIPGETEEDGLLRREYVLVGNTKAVEFDRAVDEIHANRRPLRDRRVPPTPLTGIDVPPPIIDLTNSPRSSPSHNTFPPRPLSQGQYTHATNYSPPPLSSALARALNIASKKLFGSRPGGVGYSPPAKKAIIHDRGRGGVSEGGVEDPAEETLLARLEELAQKTQVLTSWADEMYEYVKAIPQKPLPDPKKFVKKEGEPDRKAERRKNAEVEGEWNAVTCVALYMLLMSFSQKGIDALKRHQAELEMRFPDEDVGVSEGFDDALMWFKDNFIKCNDRAALVKTWLPVEFETEDCAWLDQLVYDRALQLSRTAARKELLDQASSPDECEQLYEESLWCLYALQDEVMKRDNPFIEEDKAVIADWISRTKLRLVRCKARKEMSRPERMKDARADNNLEDAPRRTTS
ncbi:Pkinase-domain-containing protein [Ramaria rubella]|nr:Pkinase-domain-containing protein [Ramaria rubella]